MGSLSSAECVLVPEAGQVSRGSEKSQGPLPH